MSKFGIDVSQHQGIINWDLVKSQINFVILRLGWIGNKNNHTIDTQFERNYSECKRLGIPVGVYVYCYCSNENTAKDGANWTIERLKGKSLDLPVYIDMEDSSIANQGRDRLTNICIAFNSIIEANGLWAGVYANRNWFDNYLNKDEIKRRYTTWIATYTSGTDKYKGEYDIWQNSSKGKINGINGNVDTNYMYRDLVAQIGNKEVSEPTDNNSNKGDFEMPKVWKNGSKNEPVYADTAFTKKIGTIFPRGEALCYGIRDGRYLVSYDVFSKGKLVSRKVGFVLYDGGVR